MIMVIGCGFVGGTIADCLEEHDIKVVRIDPRLNDNKIYDLMGRELFYIPTGTLYIKNRKLYIKQ